jgi:hypothetical protein
MKHLIRIALLLPMCAYAGEIRVFNSEAEIPASCEPRIGIMQPLNFSPKATKQSLEKLEIRVLKECKKSTKRVRANAFLLKGFEKREESDGSISLRCTGVAYQCK